MADLNITQTTGGLKIVSDISSLVINEYSTKRSNVSKDEITIVSDLKDNYAEYDIDFSKWDNVLLNSVAVADAEELETLLSDTAQKVDATLNSYTSPAITYMAAAKDITTITAQQAISSRQISVDDASSVAINDYIVVFNYDLNRFYQGRALNAATSPILLDNPLDIQLEIGDIVGIASSELAVNGSVTPQTFVFRGDQSNPIDITVGITRLIVTMQLTNAGSLDEFGNIPSLTNGIVLRSFIDGEYHNIFNAKTNRDLKNYGYDLEFIDALPPTPDSVSCRISFSGKDKMDTMIRIKPGDNVELIIQDDLTSITSFNFIMEGRVIK